MTAADPADAAVLARVDDGWVAELAGALIATPGHEDLPQHERDVAVLLAERLTAAGVDTEPRDIGGGRLNVLARVRGAAAGPTLMLVGHLDTVPGYGMADPFAPRWDGDRLRGRGAVDMKGALASMAGALLALVGRDLRGELLLAAVAGEERGSPGARRLADEGPRADLAVVGEPTGMDIAVAHKGAMWIEVAFRGRAAHGSTPELGVNAIEHAAAFVTRLRSVLGPRLAARAHPELGPATLNVGHVSGGDRPPMVPDRCVVELDRRWLPGETHQGVLEELAALLRDMEVALPDLEWRLREMDGTGTFVHHPLDTPQDTPGIAELAAAIADAGGPPPRRFGARFWTDAALLAHAGTPAVVCGPGDIARAHTSDEYVEGAQLRLATRAYALAAARYLGRGASGGCGASGSPG